MSGGKRGRLLELPLVSHMHSYNGEFLQITMLSFHRVLGCVFRKA